MSTVKTAQPSTLRILASLPPSVRLKKLDTDVYCCHPDDLAKVYGAFKGQNQYLRFLDRGMVVTSTKISGSGTRAHVIHHPGASGVPSSVFYGTQRAGRDIVLGYTAGRGISGIGPIVVDPGDPLGRPTGIPTRELVDNVLASTGGAAVGLCRAYIDWDAALDPDKHLQVSFSLKPVKGSVAHFAGEPVGKSGYVDYNGFTSSGDYWWRAGSNYPDKLDGVVRAELPVKYTPISDGNVIYDHPVMATDGSIAHFDTFIEPGSRDTPVQISDDALHWPLIIGPVSVDRAEFYPNFAWIATELPTIASAMRPVMETKAAKAMPDSAKVIASIDGLSKSQGSWVILYRGSAKFNPLELWPAAAPMIPFLDAQGADLPDAMLSGGVTRAEARTRWESGEWFLTAVGDSSTDDVIADTFAASTGLTFKLNSTASLEFNVSDGSGTVSMGADQLTNMIAIFHRLRKPCTVLSSTFVPLLDSSLVEKYSSIVAFATDAEAPNPGSPTASGPSGSFSRDGEKGDLGSAICAALAGKMPYDPDAALVLYPFVFPQWMGEMLKRELVSSDPTSPPSVAAPSV